MKNAIILHGMPSKEEYYNPESEAQSNKHWIPWIQRQLILNDVLAQAPELPYPFEPVYEKWKAVFDQFEISEQTMLIGHSCGGGGGFLVRWLTETEQKVGKVALIAPFIDPNHDEVQSDFFDFDVDKEITAKTAGLRMFYSTDDYPVILQSIEILKSCTGIEEMVLQNMGHLTYTGMQKREFPELAAWLLQ